MEKENEEKNKWTPSGIGIPSEVAHNYCLTQTEKILFGYVQNLSKSSKGCYASNEWLGKVVGVGPQSISNALSKLQEYLYIEIIFKQTNNGLERNIFINAKMYEIYKPLVECFYENIEENDKEDLLKNLYTVIKKIIAGYKKNYSKENNKENNKERDIFNKLKISQNEKNLILPEIKSKKLIIPDARRIKLKTEKKVIDVIKPKTLLQKDFLESTESKFSYESRKLLLYWNELGKPFTQHRLDFKSNIVIKSLQMLDDLMNSKNGSTYSTIKQSIENYHKLLLSPCFKFWIKHPIISLSLSDFIIMGSQQKERIEMYKLKHTKENYPDISSWYTECLLPFETLRQKYTKEKEDKFTDLTQAIKERYFFYSGKKKFNIDEENALKEVSMLIKKYLPHNIRNEEYARNLWKCIEQKNNFNFLKEKIPWWIGKDGFFKNNFVPYLIEVGCVHSSFLDKFYPEVKKIEEPKIELEEPQKKETPEEYRARQKEIRKLRAPEHLSDREKCIWYSRNGRQGVQEWDLPFLDEEDAEADENDIYLNNARINDAKKSKRQNDIYESNYA